MITTLVIVLPLLAGIASFVLNNKNAKNLALAICLAELCLVIYAASVFEPAKGMQMVLDVPWIPALGIHYHVGIDGIGLPMLLLTAFLMLFIILSVPQVTRQAGKFIGLLLVMEAALMGVFTALDGFLFYVFWEMALVPIWFICLLWGSGNNLSKITLKFFIYTLFGSLLMLTGLIYLYFQTPEPHSFGIASLYALDQLNTPVQSWLFWAFFLAFAIKIPIFPFHTWQPDTYVAAPAQGTMVLSGIMLKMGIFGLIRWLFPVLPLGVHNWMPVAIILSVTGAVYASVIALMQQDIKRLLAYSSMAHVGIIGASLFSLTFNGLTGTVYQMLAHGVNTVALFYIADIIERRNNTRNLSELGGIALADSAFAVLSFIAVLGAVAFPFTNGFVGELYLLYGLFEYSLPLSVMAGFTIITGAAYMLRFYQKTMFGNLSGTSENIVYAGKTELCILIPLSASVILMGVYPMPLLNISSPGIQEILKIIHF